MVLTHHVACTFSLQIATKYGADKRTRIANLLQLRVIGHVLLGGARVCKSRISKRVSFLGLALCCTVLRSLWCQSGIKPFEKLWSGVEIARPYALGSHSYCKIYLKR